MRKACIVACEAALVIGHGVDSEVYDSHVGDEPVSLVEGSHIAT